MNKSLKLLTIFSSLIFCSISHASPAWHSWEDVIPFPDVSEIDFGAVQTVDFEVYDINAINPEKCPGHCFRVSVYVNGQLFARVPTSPGSARHSWGGRTPEFRNAKVVKASWMPSGYRIHNRGYRSNKRRDNLRYFLVFEHGGRDYGIGFHGDKDGAYPVTGKPESHGCMRLTDANAFIFNQLARAVLENTGSLEGMTLNAYHTKRKWF